MKRILLLIAKEVLNSQSLVDSGITLFYTIKTWERLVKSIFPPLTHEL